MKEIHAYKNDDGTYRVEILDIIETFEARNNATYRETTQAKTTIDKAMINITPLNSLDSNGEVFTIIC